jgi:Mn-dependent DtxR family transcriptional regulator/transposase
MNTIKRYRAARTPAEVRTFAARLFVELERRSVKRKLTLEAMDAAGYTPSTRTLSRHIQAARLGGDVLSKEKATGRAPSLDEEQREIAAGFVLAQNSANLQVHLADYISFVDRVFHVTLSPPTASRYLDHAGFTSKKTQTKSSGYKLDAASECRLMLSWVQEHHDLLKTPGKRLCSVDFTFTGHRIDHHQTFSISGGAQPKSNVAISRYTNCIATVVWADGRNRTPAVLFTLNPKFRRDRPSTAKRAAEVARLDHLLKEYEIDASRVTYVEKEKGEKGIYVAENADLVRRFWAIYEIPEDCVAFSDNGSAFYPEGRSVLNELGFAVHAPYAAAVHQYLSPNDNRLHGAAKKSWRESGVDFADDVKSCLLLLRYLDENNHAHGKKWWHKNMLDLHEETVEELISGTNKRRSEICKERLRKYLDYTREEPDDTPIGLKEI